MQTISPYQVGGGSFYPIPGYAPGSNQGYPSVMPSQTSSDMFGGLVTPNKGGQGGGKNKNGLNQLQQNLINQMFGQSVSPYSGGFFQSPYQANIQPSFFNYNPATAFQGLNGYQAQNIQFDPNKAFSPLQQAGAATASYDPNSWLNKINTNVQGTGFNFNPNSYTSQATNNFLSGIGNNVGLLQQIQQEMEKNNKGLPSLDPGTQDLLNKITDSQKADLSLNYGEQKRQLVNDLYSRGVNNSTIGNDAAGKLLYGQQNILKGILSDSASRQIDLQKNMRDAVLQNLLGQGNTIAQGIQGQESGAGISQQGDIARMGAGLQTAQANADIKNQFAQLNAQMMLQKALQGNQTASQLSQFNAGNQQQSNIFNAGQSNDRGNIIGQLLGQQASQNAGFQNQAGQFNAQQKFDIASMINQGRIQTGLANAGFANTASQQNANINAQMAQTNLNAMLQKYGGDQNFLNNMFNQFFNRKQGNKQIGVQQNQLELQRQQQQAQLAFQYYQLQQQLKAQGGFLNGFSKILGGLGGAAAAFL